MLAMNLPPARIDRDSPVPLYFQLSELLEQQIVRGRWQPGQRLPSEPEIASHYGLSRTTIRQALGRLEQRGLIERRKGQGTFVAKSQPRSWLLQSSGGFFEEEVERMGRLVTSDVLRAVVRGPIPIWAADALGLAGAEGATLARVRSVDGLVAMYVVNHLPSGLGEAVLPLDDSNESLYQRLKDRAGAEAAGGRRVLEAVRAEDQLADLLQVPPGAPLLFIESVSWDSNLQPFDCYQLWLRSDRMRIDISVAASPALSQFAAPELAGGVT
jgi:DNA-binding GntR family transcriptional regulator